MPIPTFLCIESTNFKCSFLREVFIVSHLFSPVLACALVVVSCVLFVEYPDERMTNRGRRK